MNESPDSRTPRRRGGPRERIEAPVEARVEVVVEPVVAPRAARPAPPAPTPPSVRETTDFDGLRAIGDMDPAAVRAAMEAFVRPSGHAQYKVGQRVVGRVTSIGAQAVFLDLGGKSDASLDRMELGAVELGEQIVAYVAGFEGEVRLTTRPSGSGAREAYAEAMAAKAPVQGTVVAAADSGWQVSLGEGVRGFCPGSHTGEEDCASAEHVSRTFTFLVHDLRGRDVVLSRRALLEAENREVQNARYGEAEVNAVLSGVVSRLADFGAFVKLENGLEGLVHISNLTDRRVKHPSEVVKEGDEVRVRVLSVDRARRRIDLGLRQAAEGSANSDLSAAPEGSRAGFGLFASLLKDVKVKEPKGKRK